MARKRTLNEQISREGIQGGALTDDLLRRSRALTAAPRQSVVESLATTQGGVTRPIVGGGAGGVGISAGQALQSAQAASAIPRPSGTLNIPRIFGQPAGPSEAARAKLAGDVARGQNSFRKPSERIGGTRKEQRQQLAHDRAVELRRAGAEATGEGALAVQESRGKTDAEIAGERVEAQKTIAEGARASAERVATIRRGEAVDVATLGAESSQAIEVMRQAGKTLDREVDSAYKTAISGAQTLLSEKAQTPEDRTKHLVVNAHSTVMASIIKAMANPLLGAVPPELQQALQASAAAINSAIAGEDDAVSAPAVGAAGAAPGGGGAPAAAGAPAPGANRGVPTLDEAAEVIKAKDAINPATQKPFFSQQRILMAEAVVARDKKLAKEKAEQGAKSEFFRLHGGG